ncbi:MAG: phytase [Chloroflexaceae bacterium]|nr:phytase [Chloroflexaceae bacterium]
MRLPRVASFVMLLAFCLSSLLLPTAQPALAARETPLGTQIVRFSQFNASLNRNAEGQLVADLSNPNGDSPTITQAKTVAEIIQRTNPDVLLINEFDYVADGSAARLFNDNFLAVSQNGAPPVSYPYFFVAPSNTGVASGFDLDRNGVVVSTPGAPGYGNDAFGFGNFPGQFGMVVYSKYPIDTGKARTFQNFLWKDMPGALLPTLPDSGESWYSPEALNVFRLSSKSHWDLPIAIGDRTVHVLASHPTPPVFDGPEDRNGKRNHDEIRFWADYITPGQGDYIYDDKGNRGGLQPGASFVIMGDQNADPNDGDSFDFAIRQLLNSPLVNTSIFPTSEGGVQQAALQGRANANHKTPPQFDTADFADSTPGNLQVDYVLPSADIRMVEAEVFWPLNTDPLFRLVGVFTPSLPGGFPSSDHRLIWADLDLIPSVAAKFETRSIFDLDPEAVPPGGREGDADDPAIWINPNDPAQSIVIGVLKNGGLDVYDLEGNVLQSISAPPGQRLRYNNVDLQYGFNLGGQPVDLAVVTDRRNDLMVFYRINPQTRQLEDVTAPNLPRVFTADSPEGLENQETVYGVALYRDANNSFYAFVSQRSNNKIAQLELRDNGAGRVTWSLVRTLTVPIFNDDLEESQVEGMVVDQELGLLYAGQENVGIWRFAAAANGSTTGELIHKVYPDGTELKADVEGLTIYYGRDGSGYLLASSQGDSTFAVFDRQGNNPFLGSFRIGDGNGIDGVQNSDGADVVNVPLGPNFPRGLLVVHDGSNDPPLPVEDDGEIANVNTNFKLVAWDAVASAFPVQLQVDTTSYNPRRERLTPVLDGFNRADGPVRGSPPNVPWYGVQGLRGYRISGNQLDVESGGPIYWAERFGPTQQAFVTFTQVDANASRQSLVLKMQGATVASGALLVHVGVGQISVESYGPGNRSTTLASFPANVRNGDQVGAQALADGTLRVVVNGVEVGRASASAFANQGGRIGLLFENASGAVLDDFGGGSIR